MYWDKKLYVYWICEYKLNFKRIILYRGCLFLEVNECDLDFCLENFICNNIVIFFDCFYCNVLLDNCIIGML